MTAEPFREDATLADQKLEAETKKLRAEALKLEAEARKLERDHQVRWRVASIAGASLLLAIAPAATVYVIVQKNANDEKERRQMHDEALATQQQQRIREEADRQFRRWRSRTGSFEFGPEAWQMAREWSTLPECDSIAVAALQTDHPCGSAVSGPALCRDGGQTHFRRLRCWLALPQDTQYPEPSARAFTAAITAIDFDTSAPDGGTGSRHPRLQLYIPNQGQDQRGFEIAAQVWNDTMPYMVGVSWTANGRTGE